MYGSAWIDEYGKPLVPLDEDKLNGVKPLRIQDQIVTDENGKRRFHGAFTGGFSAGYWNTVGSKEGWTPQNFKSSRAEKAAQMEQKPLDFMDEEDLEEFGNAPLSMQQREEDPTIITEDEINLKRVLNLDESKIMAAVEPERRAKEAEKAKRKAAEFNRRKLYVLQKYGCDTTSATNVWHNVSEEDINAAFLPAIPDSNSTTVTTFEELLTEENNKKTTLDFGFGDYTPLNSDVTATTTTATIPLLANNKTNTSSTDKSNKTNLSIRGHAFGVGALEEEDEDIYAREDMSRYDFSLDDKRRRQKKQCIIKMLVKDDDNDDEKNTNSTENANSQLTGETDLVEEVNEKVNEKEKEKEKEALKRKFLKPRPWAERKTRFGPPPTTETEKSEPMETEQNHLETSSIQQKKLKMQTDNTSLAPADIELPKKEELLQRIAAKSANFVSVGEEPTIINKLETLTHSKATADTKIIKFPAAFSAFKPFAHNEPKQKRYEQFLASQARTEQEIGDFLKDLQPSNWSKWDREVEMKEFIQARKLYKPLEGLMGNRFVTGQHTEDITNSNITKEVANETQNVERNVTLIRTTLTWRPSALLCKRYNIAEPITAIDSRGRNKQQQQQEQTKLLKPSKHLSVFDYLESSVHKKTDFVTPVIIPKHKTITEEKESNKTTVVLNTPPTMNKRLMEKVVEKQEEKQEKKVKTCDTQNAIEKRTSRWNMQTSEKTENDANVTSSAQQKSESTKNANDTEANRLKFVPRSKRSTHEEEATTEISEKKRDLFQAIFSDNDDDVDEEKKAEEKEKTEDTFTENVAPTIYSHKTTVSANLLRNMSPPRGIFAAFFAAKNSEDISEKTESKDRSTNEASNNDSEKQEIIENNKNNTYGPAIPSHLQNKQPINSEEIAVEQSVGTKIAQEQRISYKGLEIIEKWVEPKDMCSSSSNSSESSASESSHSDSGRVEREHRQKHKRKSKKQTKSKNKSKQKSKRKHREKHRKGKRGKH